MLPPLSYPPLQFAHTTRMAIVFGLQSPSTFCCTVNAMSELPQQQAAARILWRLRRIPNTVHSDDAKGNPVRAAVVAVVVCVERRSR